MSRQKQWKDTITTLQCSESHQSASTGNSYKSISKHWMLTMYLKYSITIDSPVIVFLYQQRLHWISIIMSNHSCPKQKYDIDFRNQTCAGRRISRVPRPRENYNPFSLCAHTHTHTQKKNCNVHSTLVATSSWMRRWRRILTACICADCRAALSKCSYNDMHFDRERLYEECSIPCNVIL